MPEQASGQRVPAVPPYEACLGCQRGDTSTGFVIRLPISRDETERRRVLDAFRFVLGELCDFDVYPDPHALPGSWDVAMRINGKEVRASGPTDRAYLRELMATEEYEGRPEGVFATVLYCRSCAAEVEVAVRDLSGPTPLPLYETYETAEVEDDGRLLHRIGDDG